MASASEIRTRNRKIVVHKDGTAYQIRKLREVDFVAKNMLVMAAAAGPAQEERSLIAQYIREHPEEVLDTLNVEIVCKGVIASAQVEADGAGGWRVRTLEPLRVVTAPTDAADAIYYLDMGEHFKWLVDEIREFSALTEEAARQQDSFPEQPRSDAVLPQ